MSFVSFKKTQYIGCGRAVIITAATARVSIVGPPTLWW